VRWALAARRIRQVVHGINLDRWRGAVGPTHRSAALRPMKGTWTACPLCRSGAVSDFATAHGRAYGECARCRLIHLAPEHRLSPVAERAEYATHRNDPADPRYRSFLSRVAVPLVARLSEGAEGLDFGSGPGPALSVMLEEQGFPMSIYDPFFAPDPQALERTYDFITCTETAEHFVEPGKEFDRLHRMLRPGGILALMTEVYVGEPELARWRYARERSHVCFYRPETLEWLAGRYGWTLECPGRNVFFFRRRQSGGPRSETTA
jgi:SAM-dependent methyltransferase